MNKRQMIKRRNQLWNDPRKLLPGEQSTEMIIKEQYNRRGVRCWRKAYRIRFRDHIRDIYRTMENQP